MRSPHLTSTSSTQITAEHQTAAATNKRF